MTSQLIHRFVTKVEMLTGNELGPEQIVNQAVEEFRQLLSPDELPKLPVGFLNPDRISARIQLLYRSAAVTVFIIAASPGFASDIHDHTTWGLVGQVLGSEVETIYRRLSDGHRGPGDMVGLERVSSRQLTAGHVVRILPPKRDLHRVANVGDSASVTLHAFGEDIVCRGFSVYKPGLYTPETFVGEYENEDQFRSGAPWSPDVRPVASR